MRQVYLNGDFVNEDEAKISVFDRGFLFGDGVYEVVPMYDGQLLGLDEHLQRLQNSLQQTGIQLQQSPAELSTILQEVAQRNQQNDRALYIQVTRGIEQERNHKPAKDTVSSLFVCSLLGRPVGAIKKGLRVMTQADNRWSHCHIKAITLLPSVMALMAAEQAGVDEVIFSRDGLITEAAASNVFLVEAGKIYTPKKDQRILGGVTRDLLIKLAQAEGLPLIEEDIATERLQQADEIWLSSSSKEVSPVIKLDEQWVGKGQAGPVWQQMHQLYCQHIEAL